jgi:hypothetical protein
MGFGSGAAHYLVQDCLEDHPQERKVKGRWHDNRHTLITEMAENGAGDETIMEIAGQVDRQMLRHYRHIRMKAKRAAVESVIASRRGDSQLGSASKAGCLEIESMDAIPSLAILKELVRELERLAGESQPNGRYGQFHLFSSRWLLR